MTLHPPATTIGTRPWQVLPSHRRSVFTLVAISAISTVTEIAVIALIGMLSGRLMGTPLSVPIVARLSDRQLVGVTLITAALKTGLDILYARLHSQTIREYEGGLRSRIAWLQANCAWSAIEDSDTGSIHSLLWTSVHRSREGFAQSITFLCAVSSLSLVLIATLVTVRLMIFPLLVGLLLFWLAFKPIVRASHRASTGLRDAYAQYGTALNESISLGMEARVLGVQDVLATRLESAGYRAASAVSRQTYLSTILGFTYTNVIYLLAAAGLGIVLALDLNNPAPLAATVLLLYRSMGYGKSVQAAQQGFTNSIPFAQDVDRWICRLTELEEANPPSSSSARVDDFESVELRNARLVYQNGHVGVRSVSTTISQGDAVALIGPSGSGKSSLVSLVLGLRQPTSGEVVVNGVPLDCYDLRDWRDHLAFVPQNNLLFDASIEENVRCWRDIPHDRVIQSLRDANILDEVLSMDAGLATSVGEGGKRLSGGQRQRICLARALASSPSLLILDEPTSALDPASERAVKDTLRSIKGTTTLLIIAHRMTTISMCDRVLVMEAGELVHDDSTENAARDSAFFARALELSDGS